MLFIDDCLSTVWAKSTLLYVTSTWTSDSNSDFTLCLRSIICTSTSWYALWICIDPCFITDASRHSVYDDSCSDALTVWISLACMQSADLSGPYMKEEDNNKARKFTTGNNLASLAMCTRYHRLKDCVVMAGFLRTPGEIICDLASDVILCLFINTLGYHNLPALLISFRS